MLRTRVIPTLLIREESLVKTKKFQKFNYIGDPVNTVRIFNELEVDEILLLDILASKTGQDPNFELLSIIANECFMPLAYGGGISCVEHAKKIFDIGFEKIVLNSNCINNHDLIKNLASTFGSQSIIISIDVKKDIFGRPKVFTHSGTKNSKLDPIKWAKEVEILNAGEILITSIDKEGTWEGFDIELVNNIVESVEIPVIAHGGGGNKSHINELFKSTKVSAIALGNMVVYQKKDMGVLINFPSFLKELYR